MSCPLFDTNVLIDYMKDEPGPRLAVSTTESAIISRMTWIELMAGFDHVNEEAMSEHQFVLSMFRVIEIDAGVSTLAAQILAERQRTRLSGQRLFISGEFNVIQRDLTSEGKKNSPHRCGLSLWF